MSYHLIPMKNQQSTKNRALLIREIIFDEVFGKFAYFLKGLKEQSIIDYRFKL